MADTDPANDKSDPAKLANEDFFKLENESQDFNWVRTNPACLVNSRNQSRTNCCWAFAVVEAVFAAHVIFNKATRACLGSVQFLIDFVHLVFSSPSVDQKGDIPFEKDGYGNNFGNAFEFIKTHGMDREVDYKKFDGQCNPCKLVPDQEKGKPRIKIASYGVSKEEYDIVDVFRQLRKQPVVVSVSCPPSLEEWPMSYGCSNVDVYKGFLPKEQIAHDESGGMRYQDHALLLVRGGIGETRGYVIAKNSWGENWGFHGYIKIDVDALMKMIGCYAFPIDPQLVLA